MKYFVLLLFSVFAMGQNGINTPLKAFPTAYGGGANVTGHRGKLLAIVNTLNRNTALILHTDEAENYYTGGLFPALQNPNVGYIVFNVSGLIQLGTGGMGAQFGFNGMTGVNNKYIAGQTAPLGGITLTGGTIRFNGGNGDNDDLIFRYLKGRPVESRFGGQPDEDSNGRVDDDAYTWGLLFYGGGQNIIVDHYSASFANDKAVGQYMDDGFSSMSTIGLTFQNCLIADSGTGAVAGTNPGRSTQPEDRIDNISFNSNLFVGVHRTPNLSYNGFGEINNNIAHDGSARYSNIFFELILNNIGNVYQDPEGGYDTNTYQELDLGVIPVIYTSNNVHNDFGLTGANGENNKPIWRDFWNNDNQIGDEFFTSTINPTPVTIQHPYPTVSTDSIYNRIVTTGDVGAYKYFDNDGYVQTYRDPLDTKFLTDAQNNTEITYRQISDWVLPSMPSNTRPSTYDTDNDGMSDAWEIREFGDLSQSYGGDFDGDGYENIEEFLNQVDGDVVEPTCSDGIQNGDETGIDCGGSCDPCEAEPTPSTPRAILKKKATVWN